MSFFKLHSLTPYHPVFPVPKKRLYSVIKTETSDAVMHKDAKVIRESYKLRRLLSKLRGITTFIVTLKKNTLGKIVVRSSVQP